MPTFDDVRRIGGAFPEVVEAPSYRGMPALKVRKMPFCRLWSESEHQRDGVHGTQVLVVFCDLEQKDLLNRRLGRCLVQHTPLRRASGHVGPPTGHHTRPSHRGA